MRHSVPGDCTFGYDTCSPLTADCIYLIDENNAWRVRLALFKKVADSRCSDTDKHFDKIRTAHAEKWHPCLTGNSPCQKRFSGTRRPDKEGALGDFTAKTLKFARIFQKIYNFL